MLVVDDQALFRTLVGTVVSHLDGFAVCGMSGRAGEVERLLTELDPDVLIMDVRMPGEDPLDVAAHVRTAHPDVAVLLVSAFSREDVPAEVFDLGVGFLNKERLSPDSLREAVDGLGSRSPGGMPR